MKKVIAYVHTHWDREWYREFEDFRLRLIEVFDEVLLALKNNELPFFYFDGQTAALEDYLEIHPEKYEHVKTLIKEKKLRIGPFYCSSDSFLVSGESLYRNFEIGIKKSKELGETEFIGYLADTFGHSKSIPTILKSIGIDKACLWRGLGDLNADLNWQGINTTYLIQGYFQDFLNTDWDIKKKAEHLKKYLDKIALKSSNNILLPIGADHLAIPKNLNKQIDEINKIYKDYKIELKTPFEYFEQIKKREKVEGEFLNNKLNFILSGVYSTRIPTKQLNAESQWLLTRKAEILQALSYYHFKTPNKQNEIDYAYKTLFKNHAHDSIYGCSLDEVDKCVQQRFKKVKTISNGIIKRTLRDLTTEDNQLSVINLSNYTYSGPIEITTEKKLPKWMKAVKIRTQKGFTDKKLYNINDIPITEDITNLNTYLISVKNLPAFSLTKIDENNICTISDLKGNDSFIENKNIKLEIENGNIYITDKIKNEKYPNFISITNRADIGDSYNFGALKNDKPIEAKLIKHKLKEKNKQRYILNLIYEISIPNTSTTRGRNKKIYKHRLNINVILYNQSEYLEFEIDWENKSKNHILQIGFNLKEDIKTTLNEDLFGTVTRKFNPNYNIYNDVPAPKGIELKPNTSPMQRFISTQNFALITKGNQEYEINKNTVNLTLLRATGIISNPHNPTRGTPAGPPIETTDMQCIGKNKANFAIAFTNNENKLFELSEKFYNPYETVFTNITNKKLLEINNKNILIYSTQIVDNKLQLRVFNISNTKQHFNINNSNTTFEIKANEIKNCTINNL